MSRWMMPRAWAASSAIAICTPKCTTFSTGSAPASITLLHGPPLEQFHDDERAAVFLTELVDGADVRVRQSRGEARFALEAAQPGGIRVILRAQELDRDLAGQTEVFSAIDDAHAALAELVEHAVVGNDRLNHRT